MSDEVITEDIESLERIAKSDPFGVLNIIRYLKATYSFSPEPAYERNLPQINDLQARAYRILMGSAWINANNRRPK